MNHHIILSCLEEDHENLQSVLHGMEAHSDFVTADMNELWRLDDKTGALTTTVNMGDKPRREAWHGFLYPDFPSATLLGLLESLPWKRLDAFYILVLNQEDVPQFYRLSTFAKAVHAGRFQS